MPYEVLEWFELQVSLKDQDDWHATCDRRDTRAAIGELCEKRNRETKNEFTYRTVRKVLTTEVV